MAKKLDKLVERMRKIMPPIEFDAWLLDYNFRNAQVASVRKQYLKGFEEDMAQLTRADFQYPTPNTHVVDGYLAVRAPEPEGFDLLQPIKGDRVSNPDYPESCSIGSDGWTAAPFSRQTPRIVPFDPENDEAWEMEEPAEAIDWDELAFVFRQVGFDTRQLYGINHIADIHIDFHRRNLAVLPKGARHNSRLGRPSFETASMRVFCADAGMSIARPWLIGTNLFE